MSGLAIKSSNIPQLQNVFIDDLSQHPPLYTTFENKKFDSNVLRQITSTTTPEQFDELWSQNPDFRLGHYESRYQVYNILSIILSCKNLPLFYHILDRNPSLRTFKCQDQTPLVFSSTTEDPEFVLNVAKHLILRGANVNDRSGGEMPLYHFASQAKFKEITKLLLLNGAVTKNYSEADITFMQRFAVKDDIEKMNAVLENIKNVLQELHVEIPIIEWIRDDETGVLSQIV